MDDNAPNSPRERTLDAYVLNMRSIGTRCNCCHASSTRAESAGGDTPINASSRIFHAASIPLLTLSKSNVNSQLAFSHSKMETLSFAFSCERQPLIASISSLKASACFVLILPHAGVYAKYTSDLILLIVFNASWVANMGAKCSAACVPYSLRQKFRYISSACNGSSGCDAK